MHGDVQVLEEELHLVGDDVHDDADEGDPLGEQLSPAAVSCDGRGVCLFSVHSRVH